MWALNGLPKATRSLPIVRSCADDRFPVHRLQGWAVPTGGCRKILGDTDTDYVQTVVDDDSSDKVPKPFFMIWGLVVGLSMVPLLIVLKMRVSHSSQPRFHVFYDGLCCQGAQQYSHA